MLDSSAVTQIMSTVTPNEASYNPQAYCFAFRWTLILHPSNPSIRLQNLKLLLQTHAGKIPNLQEKILHLQQALHICKYRPLAGRKANRMAQGNRPTLLELTKIRSLEQTPLSNNQTWGVWPNVSIFRAASQDT